MVHSLKVSIFVGILGFFTNISIKVLGIFQPTGLGPVIVHAIVL